MAGNIHAVNLLLADAPGMNFFKIESIKMSPQIWSNAMPTGPAPSGQSQRPFDRSTLVQRSYTENYGTKIVSITSKSQLARCWSLLL